MTRRRQKQRNFTFIHKSQPETKNQEPEILTFRVAWARLVKTIKFRILPSKYLGHKCYIKNHGYKISGETVDYFFIAAFPNQAFPKVGNRYKISK